MDGFTISEVAKRAKINRALIYHYFQNRDNLVAQAIDHLIERNQEAAPQLSADSVERNVRMHIQHPEIARFFYQLLLTGRPLLTLGERLRQTIAALERLREERAPETAYDIAFGMIALVLAQMAWPFAREELARLLDISVEEADERFIAQVRWATELGIRALTDPTE